MSNIQCELKVTNKDWRYVYNSVINFFNEEIQIAYAKASDFYLENKFNQFSLIQENFESYISENTLSNFQSSTIRAALFSGTNQKLYKPKKNNFKKINNRCKMINTQIFSISFQKEIQTITFETLSFDNLDNFIANNSFISEFINMVNTINWPTRTGPNKTVKGCTMALITYENNNPSGQIFYKVGPNPPQLNPSFQDVTISEPSYLKSDMVKNIKLVSSTTTEETSQPVPEILDVSEF